MKAFQIILFFISLSVSLSAQRTITGTIMLEGEGEAIGANVVVDGNEEIGTVTDFDGTFSLDVPDDTKALKISYTCEPITVSILNISDISVTLKAHEDAESIVLISFPSRPSIITVPLSIVSGEEIKYIPVSHLSNKLHGQAQGVQVISENGKPGANAFINIRGVGSSFGNINHQSRERSTAPFSIR